MLFTEAKFLVFFFFCFSIRWLLPGYGMQKRYLLLCSYVFYGAWDWRFLFLIFASTAVDYLVGLGLSNTQNTRRRLEWLWLSLTANLGFLGFFKYYNFFVTSGSSLLGRLGFQVQPATLEIVLPVGISFFTFQTMSYTIDVYRGVLAPIRSFRDFALFVSFFPQLVAGPIVRARGFLPQLQVAPRLRDVDFRGCLTLFWIGYFKKACIADNLATVIDPVFAHPGRHCPLDVLLGSVGYSVQIYCDFSGYSDMAIAVAGLLGFKLCLNFDAPYLAANVQDFWRRWHISLSSWLRDYLYISMGGSRGTRWRTYRNLMVTMILGGLWHGADMTFVLWGTVHGFALCLHRLLNESGFLKGFRVIPGFGLLSWMLTLSWVVFCFTLFRCDSIGTFFELISRLTAGGKDQLAVQLWALVLWVGVAHVVVYRYRPQLSAVFRRAPVPAFAFAIGIATSVALFFTPINNAPFIYFQF